MSMKKYFTTFITGLALTLSVVLSVPNTAFAGWTSGGFSIPYTVTAPIAPTVTISADPVSVTSGSPSYLTWSSTNATSCTASNGWSGSKATSGTNVSTGALTSTTTFTIACTGPGGTSAPASATVTVSAVPLATVSISVDNASVTSGQSTTIRWYPVNASSCTASGDWSGSKSTSNGSQSTGALTSSKTYTITCKNSANVDSAPASATVTVSAVPQATVSISVDNASVTSGQSTTIRWYPVNASSCTASGGWSGSKSTSNGSESTGALTSSKTYTIICKNSANVDSAPASATVTVTGGLTPSVTLYADPAGPVAYNSQFALWWSTANVTSCTANNVDVSWTGNKTTAGGGQMVVATATKTYAIDCTGPNGPASASATVAVTGGPVTASISVSPTSVASGGSSTITWSSTNATSCTGSGHWSGSKTLSGSGGTGVLTSSPTYTLTCTGPGGSASASATVTVSNAPTVTLSASPTNVSAGNYSTLTWSSTNATSCTASNYWSGSKPLSGSGYTQTLYENSSFTLTCSGPGGTASATAVVTVEEEEQPQPYLYMSASPVSIGSGSSSTLYWSSENVTSCTASGDWSGSKVVNGSQTTGAVTSNKTYTLTCTGPYGTVNSSALVNVITQPPLVNIYASPSDIASGEETVVVYNTQYATSCTGSGGGAGWDGTRSAYGDALSFFPYATKTFTITCTGPSGSTMASAAVIVDGKPLGTKPVFVEF